VEAMGDRLLSSLWVVEAMGDRLLSSLWVVEAMGDRLIVAFNGKQHTNSITEK